MRRPIHSSSLWFASPFIAIAAALGLEGMHGFITYGSWLRSLIAVLAITIAVMAFTRLMSRSRLLPTVIGLLTATIVSIPVFVRDDLGQRRWLPTPEAVRGLWTVLGDGVTMARETVAPADVERPLAALITAGIVIVFLVADHIAVSWRASATAGLILLAEWLPAIVMQNRVSTRLLLAAIACWAMSLALTRKSFGTAQKPTAASSLGATAAVVGLVVLATPFVLGAPGWGAIPRILVPNNPDGTTQLDLDLDLRNSLNGNPSSPVLVYVSSGAKPEAFRTHTFAQFDGNAWSRADERGESTGVNDSVLWPVPVAGFGTEGLTRLSVQTLGFQGENLPVPTVPRTISIDGAFSYAPEVDEVFTESESLKDLRYTIDADLGYLSAASLRSLGFASAGDAQLDPAYTTIPSAVDAPRITALAQQLTADAGSRYDQAVALQEFLRDETTFTYDTTVQPTGSDSVSVFLDDKRGYCVQFASTMVMLARSLDIPARLAIGFLPGTPDSQGAFVVRGGDAHAWPELYFDTIGWVRFEPTPSVQTGARPGYATPEGASPEEPEAPTTAPEPVNPSLNPEPPIATSTADSPADPVASSGDIAPWMVIVLIAAAVVLLAGAFLVARRRAAARAAARLTIEDHWDRLRTGLPPDLTWSVSDAPLEAAEVFEHSLAASEYSGVLVKDRMGRLARAVSDGRYNPEGTQMSTDEAARTAEEILEQVTTTGRPARGGGQSGPQRGA